jgi:hypothetical protein
MEKNVKILCKFLWKYGTVIKLLPGGEKIVMRPPESGKISLTNSSWLCILPWNLSPETGGIFAVYERMTL